MTQPAPARPLAAPSYAVLLTFTIAGYGVYGALLLAYAALGYLPWAVAPAYALLGATLNLGLLNWMLYASGAAQGRFPTLPYLGLNAALQLAFFALLPRLGVLFILPLLALSPVAVLHGSRLQTALRLVVLALLSGAALLLSPGVLQLPMPDAPARALAWLALLAALGFGAALLLRIEGLSRNLIQDNLRLDKAYRALRRYALRDDLTGLANRRIFLEYLNGQM